MSTTIIRRSRKKASTAQAQAGTDDNSVMTPLKTAEAIAALGSGGTTTFTGLTDTPSSFAGQGTKAVTVNVAENALEFTAVAGATTVFPDDTFRVQDNLDATKQVAIEASAITTATTRTITMPDQDIDLTPGTGSFATAAEGDLAATALQSSDIGVTVQGYDADTAKYDDVTANFTGTLQNGGSNVVVDTDIGSTVQAYSAVLAGTTASFTTADETKLDGIEALADVTDATNVDAAGAVMNTDTTTAAMSFVIDEDTMASNLDTKVPTQQSVKAYVDGLVSSPVNYKGSYDASLNSPDLDTSPSGVSVGDMYTVTVAGNFFTIAVEVGDVLISEQDNATLEAHWTVVNKNLDAASIKTSYESNADTNAFTDAEQSKLAGIEANATADQTAADIRGLGFFDTTNDGTGSGLDADLLDGNEATAFATAAQGTLADSATQPGDNVSTLTNDSGFITGITAEPIGDLSDVTITAVSEGDQLVYSSGSWQNSTPVAPTSSASVQTTDATPTVLKTVSVTSNTEKNLEFSVRGHEAATGDTIWRKLFLCVKNEAGTTSLVGGVGSFSGNDTGGAAWDITAAATGALGTVTVTVTGEAAHTIDWVCTTVEN